jgi:hypothetical protein
MDADDSQPARGLSFIQPIELPEVFPAGLTPLRPEFKDDDLARSTFQVDGSRSLRPSHVALLGNSGAGLPINDSIGGSFWGWFTFGLARPLSVK